MGATILHLSDWPLETRSVNFPADASIDLPEQAPLDSFLAT